jgi:hypothetical protein
MRNTIFVKLLTFQVDGLKPLKLERYLAMLDRVLSPSLRSTNVNDTMTIQRCVAGHPYHRL